MMDRTFLDWPFFDKRHRELAGKLEKWARRNVAGSHDLVDDECRRLVKALGKGGWLEHAAPNNGKPDVRTLALVRETLARHSGLADFAFAMQGLGSGPITLFGTPAQRRDYLAPVRAGKKIAAFALTEPKAGSDVAALAMTARADAEGWVLNGEKTFISNGGIADFYVVFARSGGAGSKGISAFIVDAGNPGLKVAERIEVIAPHPLARLSFKDCRVARTALVGKAGEGFKVAMATLDVFRTTVGAAALGFARRALDEALARVTKRELFGAAMAELPLVQAQLAQMALDIDASALLVYRSAWTRDRGAERVTREASMAKLHATESAQRVIDAAVQMFGGLGVTTGVPVEALYREIRALRIYEGASEVQQLVIARQVLGAHRPA
ncbi:MAG: acyl-CoA dehydrogenase family protein [Gammaproteobacteria bacterium]